MKKFLISVFSLSLIFASNSALACACGCGIFNVGTASLLPTEAGGIASLQYDYMSQTRNWHKDKKSSGHNHDKRINTQVVTAGLQYMFNRDWGAAIKVPYMTRYVKNLPHSGGMTYTRHSDIGDIRVNAIYSGFVSDMSTGITFGLKLPTGSTSARTFERNQQIGSGSTDLILGAYHMGKIALNPKWNYFAQVSWDKPFTTHGGYNPGDEASASIGTYYQIKNVSPMLQITATRKSQDSGLADPSHNDDSGYNQVFIAPGVEFNFDDYKLYADVQLPIYQSVKGNQLVAERLYKVILGYKF